MHLFYIYYKIIIVHTISSFMEHEYQDWTTFIKPTAIFKDDRSDRVVKTFLQIVQDSINFNSEHFDSLDKINDMLIDSYNVNWHSVNPTLLSQSLDMLISKSKPLDVRIENLKAGHTVNYNVSKAMFEVMKDWGYVEMLRNGKGGFFKNFAFWDFFSIVHANPDSWMPEFLDTSLRNVFFDPFATKLITKSWTRATYLVIISEYSWNTALATFPWIEEVATTGRLPFGTRYFLWGDLDMNDQQKVAREKNLVEVAMCFDISDSKNPRSVIIAWPWASIIPNTQKEGKDYEHFFWVFWKKTYKPYIPILQWICKQYWEWMYNRWFGHLLYKYSKILANMQAKFIRYTDKNFDPTTVYNLPYKQWNNIAKKIENADRLRSAWKPPIVVNEYATVWDISPIKIETLQTREMTTDYERLKEDINKEIRRWWLNLDMYYTEQGITATATITSDVAINLAIQQLQEINTSTYEMAVKIAMDIFKKNIKASDNTPFTFQPKVLMEDWTEIELKTPFTRGDLKQLLDKYEFNVIVDSKTWTYPNPIFSNRIATQYSNTLLQLWETDAAKKIIQDSASDFGLQFNITRQPSMNQASMQGWQTQGGTWKVSPYAKWPQLQDLIQTQAQTQDLLSN